MNILFPHKVTYLSDDEYWSLRIKISDQIYKEEWDNITFNPYAIYKNNLLFAEDVRSILLMNKPYNDDVERTVIRIFGERQHLSEAKKYKNWGRLRYDINNGNIKELNNSSFPLFIHYMHDYIDNIASENIFDDGKFLLDNGANINIQDDKGDTFLHHFIKTYRYSRVYFISLKTYINFIEFLIENGADPLLENKEGKSSYSIVMYEVKKQEHILDRLNSIYSYPPFKDKIKENIYSMSKDEIKDMLNIIKNDINESCYNNTRDSTDRDNMVRLCEIFYSFMNEG